MRPVFLVLAAASLVVFGACVPDFVFGDGAESTGGGGDPDGGDGGDGGRKRTRGEGGTGGGERRPTSGVGVTATSTGPGPSGPTSGVVVGSSGSSGEGGSSTAPTVSASSGNTTDATTSTGGGGTTGVPCWDGDIGQSVVCSGSESSCCADTSDYDYDQCGFPGDCGGFAWELACNESSDCAGQQCCVNLDGFGDLYAIECGSSCGDLVACDPAVGCESGGTCTRIFVQDPAHPEYDAYGFCN